MQSKYASVLPTILATLEEGRQEEDTTQPDQNGQDDTIHVYPVEGGGLLITKTPIEEEENPPIIESEEPRDTRPTTPKDPPYFLHMLLILLIFIGLDNVGAVFAQFAPTVTITITPQVKTLSTIATIAIGKGASVQGRVLTPLTLSQTQTVQTTGRGHQNARRATGILTFYNASFSSLVIQLGSVFVGVDGVRVQTDEAVTVPANNPPQDGIASVSASALAAGQQGNIAAFDINGTASSSLFVKNLAPFSNGQDERNFSYVTKGDIQGVVGQLTPRLLQSEQGALTSQVSTQESLLSFPCTPRTVTSNQPNDEAAHVTVTVSETCSGIAYNQQELMSAGERLVTTSHAASLTHFQQVGNTHLVILSHTVNGQRATLKIQLTGAWVYSLNQQPILALVAGKPRSEALHLLAKYPGVTSVHIDGVNDNELLPSDPSHIHLSIFYFVS